MSTPEENAGGFESEQPMDVTAAIGQLRLLVCGLGAGLILVSLALSGFVFKQNRDLAAAAHNHQIEIAELQTQQKPLLNVVNELAKYSEGKPELLAIFTRHGVQLTPGAPAGQAPPALNH
jgi:hypothetical protein